MTRLSLFVTFRSLAVAVIGGSALVLSSCGGDGSTSSTTSAPTTTVSVPVATPAQQADIDLVVKNWDVCLTKVGANLATGRASVEGDRHLVTFAGRTAAPIKLSITMGSDGLAVIKAADDSTQQLFDAAGTDCRYR